MIVTIVDLRCQVPASVLAAGSDPIRLTWRVEPALSSLRQLAYEVQASASAEFDEVLAGSGVLRGAEQVAVAAPGPMLRSREVRYYRVRISTQDGWTSWSPVLRVEAGLLDATDWQASAITLPGDPGAETSSPSPLVRREFHLDGIPRAARLYVTSLGLHRVAINGRETTGDLLAPGWTPYAKRLITETYDVTALLREGANVLSGTLADGWYRGRLGWQPSRDRCTYGREVGLLAQLEIDLGDGQRQVIVTDGSWKAATGEILSADLYDGADVDLRLHWDGWQLANFVENGWRPAAIVPLDLETLEPRMAPPVRRVRTWPVAAEPDPLRPGRYRLDCGQNISGFLRLRLRGLAGQRITCRHAEVLELDGALHTRSLRSARATDTYTLGGDGELVVEPPFTFHGFRFAEIESEAAILGVEAVAISSDTPARGRFTCSEPALERLHENVVWSQRDNFVAVPTDCPQRDERLGWTGDAQAFAPTACTLFDAQSFWASWLRDLAIEQDDELGVPSVVPDVVVSGELRFGRAGWADAATIVPWSVYESYGDPRILADQLDSMRRWVDSLVTRLGPDGLLGPSPQFGDWLDPDAPPDRPWQAKADATCLANAFFSYSARLTAQAISTLGGDKAESHRYEALADQVAQATWRSWSDHAETTQTGCAVALRCGIVPAAERERVASVLARLVDERDGRVATGFLGTPLVLPALSDAGLFDAAYRMLLRREMPSWLYEVDQGATTMWERWDAIRPDGSIHPGTMSPPTGLARPEAEEGHMLSFNHYAYGAVIDWVYRHVGGLAPDPARPGYRSVICAPRPVAGIDRAEASVESPYGTVSVRWWIDGDGDLSVEIGLPFGTTGSFRAPMTAASEVTLDGEACGPTTELGPGSYLITVTRPLVSVGRSAGQAPGRGGRVRA